MAAAAMILIAPTFDPLAADVQERRVEMVQGAVAKTRLRSTSRTGLARYYLDIEGRRLRTFLSAYEAAPDAGYVRAYYLPRTRRLVNLERLPNPPLPSSPDEVRNMFGRMARAFFTGDRLASANARASAAGLMDALRETTIEPPDAPDGRIAEGLERQALVGTWKHTVATVTLAENGTATVMTITGASRAGHWSIDAHGRLLTDVTGTMEPTDAVLEGDRLTIHLEGRRLMFIRGASA
jgi:hypothetical protein